MHNYIFFFHNKNVQTYGRMEVSACTILKTNFNAKTKREKTDALKHNCHSELREVNELTCVFAFLDSPAYSYYCNKIKKQNESRRQNRFHCMSDTITISYACIQLNFSTCSSLIFIPFLCLLSLSLSCLPSLLSACHFV